MKTRTKGFYWLYIENEGWTVGYYAGDVYPGTQMRITHPWRYVGSDEQRRDENFAIIGDRIPLKGEILNDSDVG